MEEWARNGFAKNLILLDRAGSAPQIPGIQSLMVPAHDYADLGRDRAGLQKVCSDVSADLFVSTYYTTPLTTPALLLVHDMIPEIMGWPLEEPMWQEKHQAIEYASAYVCVSKNTARDLVCYFPASARKTIKIIANGINHRRFHPANEIEVQKFRRKYNITNPYYILVGQRSLYKNAIISFRAFLRVAQIFEFCVVCVGGLENIESELKEYCEGFQVHLLRISDEELRAAYSGAEALVYPSKYEGFGLPLVEAMACGCPVITCARGAIPEVVEQAALYVGDEDAEEMAQALLQVRTVEIRNKIRSLGIARAKDFSWEKMADSLVRSMEDSIRIAKISKQIN